MDATELDYDLPPELIAQHPAERRDASRLLVYERATGDVRHRAFAELPEELARRARRRQRHAGRAGADPDRAAEGRGAAARATRGGGEWLALARPTRRLKAGVRYGAGRAARAPRRGALARAARRRAATERRRCRRTSPSRSPIPSRYQTVYADESGSAAAPTAGLHFTPELLEQLDVERVTLHVGLDTFRPLTAPTLEQHELHGERYSVRPEAWERIRAAERVLAVGTTTVRVLETVASNSLLQGRTSLFVTPGFEFRRVDALLTNFHLPRSTLLALVMAFAGVEETRRLYRLAIEERYRFYSFGDAMLIL